MGTIIEDYKNLRKARAEARYCINAMNNYQHEIEVAVPYEEWAEYANKMVKAYDYLGKAQKNLAQKNLTQTEFDNKYEDELKKLHAKSCFIRVFFEPAYVPFSDRPNDLMLALSVGIHRCANNHENGNVCEHLCAGCPKFGKLVKYQVLAGNAKVAAQRRDEARKALLNHFKLSRSK